MGGMGPHGATLGHMMLYVAIWGHIGHNGRTRALPVLLEFHLLLLADAMGGYIANSEYPSRYDWKRSWVNDIAAHIGPFGAVWA